MSYTALGVIEERSGCAFSAVRRSLFLPRHMRQAGKEFSSYLGRLRKGGTEFVDKRIEKYHSPHGGAS